MFDQSIVSETSQALLDNGELTSPRGWETASTVAVRSTLDPLLMHASSFWLGGEMYSRYSLIDSNNGAIERQKECLHDCGRPPVQSRPSCTARIPFIKERIEKWYLEDERKDERKDEMRVWKRGTVVVTEEFQDMANFILYASQMGPKIPF